MAANPIAGEVAVELEPGLVATFRFTWAARAVVRQVFGENWQTAVARAVVVKEPHALAVLIEAATDGRITAATALASDWPLGKVADALKNAWRFSHHGMEEPKGGEEQANPTKARPARLWTLFNRLRVPGSHRIVSGS